MTDHSPEVATVPAKAQRVLVLQGGGALGSYQAGAYQALCHFDFEPEWVAGISIGAVNAAIIAGNEGQTRVKRLKEFWEMVSAPVPWKPIGKSDHGRELFNSTSAALIANAAISEAHSGQPSLTTTCSAAYAPTMNTAPCDRLITPSTPKISVKPSAKSA